MNNVAQYEHKDCNGCQMCGDLCPCAAISFVNDELTGFWYPAVDNLLCVDCGLCVRNCPQKNPLRRVNGKNAGIFAEAEVIAAWSESNEIRLMCTSGGLFFEMASAVIRRNGAVVACSYTDDYRGAYHRIAVAQEDLLPLCGSKYLQSDARSIYKKTKELLNHKTEVLFVGTPCQVAALYQFLGREYSNLITADFICNSINSPRSQAKYIDYLEERFKGRLIYARSKDKRYGWTTFGSSAKFDNGKEYYADRDHDARVVGYHSGHLFVRESCLHCQYKELPRNADITLGDFWGIGEDERNPRMELGTSVVMANSVRGAGFIARLKPLIGWYPKTLEDVIRGNPALQVRAVTNGNSKKAFRDLDCMRFDRVVRKYRSRKSVVRNFWGKVSRGVNKVFKFRRAI